MRLLRTAIVAIALSPTASGAASMGQTQKETVHDAISALVAKGDYRAIEQRVEQDLRSRVRLADGLWRASVEYAGFHDALIAQAKEPRDLDQAIEQTRRLAATMPSAWLLNVEARLARAWKARGTGYVDTVSARGLAAYREDERKARDVLDRHKASLATSPIWYSLRLSIDNELGETGRASAAIFEEGRKRYPTYHAICFARMRSLVPKWGGSRDQMLDLLDDVAQSSEARAEAIYVRLIAYADGEGYYLIHSPRIDAAAFHDSVLTLASTYPDRQNTQTMFMLACERSDKDTAKSVLPVLGDVLPDLWRRNLPLYGTCKDWAEGRLDAFVIRDHDGEETREFLIR
jgi:hypothetical protein